MCQIGHGQISADELGIAEVSKFEFGIAEVGICEVDSWANDIASGTDEWTWYHGCPHDLPRFDGIEGSALELGTGKVGCQEVDIGEDCCTEISVCQVTGNKRQIEHGRGTKRDVVQISSIKDRAIEGRACEISPHKWIIVEIRATKVAPTEIGVLEIGLAQISITEIGITQIGVL